MLSASTLAGPTIAWSSPRSTQSAAAGASSLAEPLPELGVEDAELELLWPHPATPTPAARLSATRSQAGMAERGLKDLARLTRRQALKSRKPSTPLSAKCRF